MKKLYCLIAIYQDSSPDIKVYNSYKKAQMAFIKEVNQVISDCISEIDLEDDEFNKVTLGRDYVSFEDLGVEYYIEPVDFEEEDEDE